MRHRWIISSLLGIGLAVLIVALLFAGPREPEHNGKPLSYWVESYNKLVNDPLRPAVSMRAVTALSYCGKQGLLALVPFLTNSVLSTNAHVWAAVQLSGGVAQWPVDLPAVPLLVSTIKQTRPARGKGRPCSRLEPHRR